MADLETLDTVRTSEEGSWMHIKHPNGTKLYAGDERKREKPMRLKLLGRDSKEVRRWRHKMANERLTNALTAEEDAQEKDDEESIEIVARCTVDMENVLLDGKVLEMSLDNAKMLYGRFPFIREQADAFIGNRLNYLGNGSPTS